MAKLTIDGVSEVPANTFEFILGGGSGLLQKVRTTDLFETPITKESGTQNFWVNNALHMEHTGAQVFSGDVRFEGDVKGLPVVPASIQCKELVDMVTLVPTLPSLGTAFTPSRSVLMMTLVSEADGTPAVRYDLTVHGDIKLGTAAGTKNIKVLNLKVKGLMGDGAQYAFVDSLAFTGITVDPLERELYDYRVNLRNERTNALQFFVRGAVSGDFIARCQFKVSFVLPNQNYGVGIPFPDYASRSSSHKVFTE